MVGGFDIFLVEVCIFYGRCCEVLVGLCIWGCGRVFRVLVYLFRFLFGGFVLRCLKYLFFKGLIFR